MVAFGYLGLNNKENSEKWVCGGRARDLRSLPSPTPPTQPANGGPERRAKPDFPTPNIPFKG